MDKYLLQILHDVNTIIIPGLGALTVTNAKTGEIMFMPYLKYDDGKLAAYIAEKEGMSENDAKNLIAKYVRDIQARLDQGQTYDMYQFGRFLKNKDGDPDFENWGTYKETEDPSLAENPVLPETGPENGENTIDTAAITPVESTAPEGSNPETPQAAEIPDPESEPEPEIFEDIGIPAEKNIYLAPETFVPNMETKPDDEPKVSAENNQVIEDFPVTPAPQAPGSLDEILGKSGEKPVEENPAPIALPTQDETKVQVENVYIPPVDKPVIPVEKPAVPVVETPAVNMEDIHKDEDPGEPQLQVNWTPTEKAPKRRRSFGFWLLLILVILVIAGGITTGLFYDQVKTYIPFLESRRAEAEQKDTAVSAEELNARAEALEAAESERIAIENEATQPAPEAEAPSDPAPPAAEQPVQKPITPKSVPVPSASSDKPYHVIAGAFGSKANADRYAEKLRSSGKNGMVLGRYDNLYLVSIDAFATSAEAKSAMQGFSDVKGNKWIFRK